MSKFMSRKQYGDLVLCESGDGASLHAKGSTDEQIANGDAEYIVSAPAIIESDGGWLVCETMEEAQNWEEIAAEIPNFHCM
jgi:hypothetical protein